MPGSGHRKQGKPGLRNYCTYFDSRYLSKGLATFHSLCQYSDDFLLWVLALDPQCDEELRRIADARLRVVSLAVLEKSCPDLKNCRRTRSLIEFYFTCSPVFIHFVLDKLKAGEAVTKIDADCYFFASPELIHEKEEDCSLAITPHRFASHAKEKEIYGRFNVGWVTIRKNPTGTRCAEVWKKKCLRWCFDKPEKHRFADQKYLDEWPSRYRNVQILDKPGINQAPWNSEGSTFHETGDELLVDGQVLIFFHFHSLRQAGKKKFFANLTEFMARPNADLVQKVYVPYVNAVMGIQAMYGFDPQDSHVARSYEDPSYLHRQSHAPRSCRWSVWSPGKGAERRAIFY